MGLFRAIFRSILHLEAVFHLFAKKHLKKCLRKNRVAEEIFGAPTLA